MMCFEGLREVRGEEDKFRFFILLAEFLSLWTDLTKRKFREWKSWELEKKVTDPLSGYISVSF